MYSPSSAVNVPENKMFDKAKQNYHYKPRPNRSSRYMSSRKKEKRYFTKLYNKMSKKLNRFKNKPKVALSSNIVNKLPMVKVNLNCDLDIYALIDSGCSSELISKELYDVLFANKLVPKIEPSDLNMFAANNQRLNILGSTNVKIKIDNFTWKIKVLVLDQIGYNMVLGISFMKKSNMVLDLSRNECHFKFKPTVKVSLEMEALASEKFNNIEVQVGIKEMLPNILRLMKKYPNCFSSKLGEALDQEVKLTLLDPTIVNIRPYFLSPPMLHKMKNILDDWLSQGIIEPSTSPYSSPAFLTKKDRLVINYTELNKKLERINYPIGDLQNLYQHLSGAKIFSCIDLRSSFLQMPLAKECQHLTAFSTIFGKFNFRRLPFGIHAGSSVLTAYLDKVLHSIKFKHALAFCDDILVYSEDLESHLVHLEDVIARLSAHKLTVNLEKAKFCCEEISFLGQLIKNNTVCIDPERTKTLMNFKPPKTPKQIAQFLGMCNFFMKYIPDYATLCQPLNALRRKNVKIKWTEECQKAFLLLKEKIANPPVLQIANFKKPFVLMTDASAVAAAGCLLQANEHNDLLPIAFYSRKFSSSEVNYSVYEKEALAAIVCIEKWYEFLEVQPFKLVTDNQALSYVLNHKRKLGRLSRWTERLLSLPFTVEFKHSRDNQLADALSRMYESEGENVREGGCVADKQEASEVNCINDIINKSHEFKNKALRHSWNRQTKVSKTKVSTRENVCQLINELPLAFKDLSKYQLDDHECQNIIKSIENKTNHLGYYLNKGILMYKQNGNSKGKIFLPETVIDLVFNFFHCSYVGGHFGILRTQHKINQYFYRPDLNEIVRKKVKDCLICGMSKAAQRRYEGELVSVEFKNTMDALFVDLIGPLPKTKNQNQYIIVAVDGFSKFVWLSPIRECKTSNITKKLEEIIFANFSVPKAMITDNASYFTSAEFKRFLFKNYINKFNIAAFRANGNRSERSIRNLGVLLRAYYADAQVNWDNDLAYLQTSLNTAMNESVKSTAFQLMFFHSPNTALSNIWSLNDLVNERLPLNVAKQNLKRAIENVRKSVLHNRNRSRYSADNVKHPFVKNSLVFVRTHFLSDKAKKFTAKLAPKFKGLYRIIYFLSNNTCLIQHTENVFDTKKVHIADLKLYK